MSPIVTNSPQQVIDHAPITGDYYNLQLNLPRKQEAIVNTTSSILAEMPTQSEISNMVKTTIPSEIQGMPAQNWLPNKTDPQSVIIISDTHSSGRYIYSTFHSIMSIVAIYLSFKCNKGFDLGSFMLACCCPYIYIIYTLATKGTCGILEKEST